MHKGLDGKEKEYDSSAQAFSPVIKQFFTPLLHPSIFWILLKDDLVCLKCPSLFKTQSLSEIQMLLSENLTFSLPPPAINS